MRSLRSPFLQGGEYVTDMILWINHVLHADRGAPRWRPMFDGAARFFHGAFRCPAHRSRRRFSGQTN
jgi:hypothetical protein